MTDFPWFSEKGSSLHLSSVKCCVEIPAESRPPTFLLFFFFAGARQSRCDFQHWDGGHQRQGDNHGSKWWQIPFGPIHQERRQRHLAGGQLARQWALSHRYRPSHCFVYWHLGNEIEWGYSLKTTGHHSLVLKQRGGGTTRRKNNLYTWSKVSLCAEEHLRHTHCAPIENHPS